MMNVRNYALSKFPSIYKTFASEEAKKFTKSKTYAEQKIKKRITDK